MQAHIGMWLTTLQIAFTPQEFIQGSWHFCLMHANRLEHSLLLTHSGRQLGGNPINSRRHEQDGWSLSTWHSAFGPQGDGWQGLIGIGGLSALIFIKNQLILIKKKKIRSILLWFS